MNRWRKERRRRVISWAGRGAGAGVLVSAGATLIGLPLLGALAGGGLIAAGVLKALEAAHRVPAMTREHLREHLELSQIAGRMIAEVRMLPEMTDQLADLVELDGVLRGHASAAIVRIQSMYDRSLREGRIGMMDRLKGGFQAATGVEPVNELEFMGRTIRSLLDREISGLESGRGDANAIKLLKAQRDAFEVQVATLRRLTATLRRVSESIRTIELQAASLEATRLDPARQVVEQLAASVHADMEALDRAMTELSAPPDRPRIEPR